MNVVEVLDLETYEKVNRKKNVCAYARVSTLQEKQKTSIESQIEHYSKLIQENENYNFMGVFIDHGESGTSIEYRDQFKMMLQLAETGSLDMIITKSISRFARNTVDCLSSISLLKEYGTEVWFETENISSMDPKIEFVISIIAGMAQEESRVISENIKMSYQRRFTNGVTPMNTSKLLGYERDEDNNIIINTEESLIVKEIFNLYENNSSLTEIAKHLNSQGYKTKTGNVDYYEMAISRILDNEKYTGNALLQKRHVKKVGSKIKVRSDGIKPQYYITNSHPGIIMQEQFDTVQKIKKQKMLKFNNTLDRAKLNKELQKTEYANLLTCPHCGKYYTHRINHKGKPYEKRLLVCSSNKNKKTCKNDAIPVELFEEISTKVISTLVKNKNVFLNSLSKELETHNEVLVLHEEIKHTTAKLEQINQRISEFIISNNELDIEIKNSLITEKKRLQSKLVQDNNKTLTSHEPIQAYTRIKSIFKNNTSPLETIKHFDRILVHNRNNIDFIFDPFESNNNKGKKMFFNFKTDYMIRKTIHKNSVRVILK